MKLNIRILTTYVLICTSLVFTSCSYKQKLNKGLKNHAEFPIGTAMNIKKILLDKQLQEIQLENFNSITAEDDMKMYNILPVEGKYHWIRTDSILQYAETNNLRLHGHNLIWQESTPAWVKEKALKDSIWFEGFLKDYIHTYVGRYKGKADGWDVVNEGFETKGGNYRKTIWYEVLGEEYIAKAFTYAHEADPSAILFYNDFNIERDTAKLHGVLRMIDKLKTKGVPISGIGFQMHIRMDIPDEIIAYSLKKAAETGLQVHLSEVDIIFNKHDDTENGGIQIYSEITEDQLQDQAEKYKNLVKMYKEIVPKSQQYGITFWGFNDRDTWIRGFFNLMDWPCLFDYNLKPKPAYYGFQEGLMN